MEETHREAIQKCYPLLVQNCNIDVLLPLLVQKTVFSSAMISKYMNMMEDPLNRKRKLFLDIQQRGPNTFANLVKSLRETGQHYLADLLEPPTNVAQPSQKKHAIPFILPIYENPILPQDNANSNVSWINTSCKPITINVVASTRLYDNQSESVVPVYSTHSKRRGVVLIINNINYINDLHQQRKGAECDGNNLKQLFLQMGLQLEMYTDLTGLQMETVIVSFKNSPSLKNVDMAFIIVMGHGNQKDELTYIIGTDNKAVSTKWIEEQLDNAHCKALQKRPKIIMYQMCRGLTPDFGVARHIQIDSANQAAIRTRDDMLIAHSTLPGDASHRDIFLGTWYISVFCEVMMEHAHNTHLEDIFKLVDFRLAELRSADCTMQTSMFINLGFKNCFMHPKIYMENDIILNIYDDE